MRELSDQVNGGIPTEDLEQRLRRAEGKVTSARGKFGESYALWV